ncbi:MAG: transposase [Pseudomonadales bacterium]|nr:transposase [Pseudomonadales bacterium]
MLEIYIVGHKELLGIWVSESEGGKFCLSVLTDLQKRGIQHMLISCVSSTWCAIHLSLFLGHITRR